MDGATNEKGNLMKRRIYIINQKLKIEFSPIFVIKFDDCMNG